MRVREPFNVNLLAQEAAAAALDDAVHVARSRETNAQGKEYLYGQFAVMGLPFIPSEANFVMVDVKRDCQEVFGALLRQGVIVRTGDVFGYPTWIRVTIGTPEENQRLVVSLRKALGQ
jgi:histidinol-phosphate aminotransferase